MSFFITRPIFAVAVALIMILGGLVSLWTLPISHFPQLVPPQVQVSTQYIGANAEVVARTVTTPIEEELNGAEGMIYMSSSSTNNGDSTINLTFDIGFNQNVAQMEALARTNEAIPQLPEDVQKVGVSVQKSSSNVVLVVNLVSPKGTYDSRFLQNYADIHVTDPLSRIPGVSLVWNVGLSRYAMRVWVDPERLNNLGLTAVDVQNAIQEQNRAAPIGKLGQAPAPADQGFEYQLDALGRLQHVEQFEDVVVRAFSDGSVVRVRDVARVELGSEDYEWSTSVNGEPTASLVVYQLAGGNGIEIAGEIETIMRRLARHFPEDLEWIILYDTTRFMKASIRELIVTILTATALVVLVIFLFLQDARSTLIPLLAVPVSLIGAFAAMPVLGFSINTLSLLGLVVAVALVVDDAIVVVENVRRRMDEGGGDLQQLTLEAMTEVRGPILATTLVLIAIFVPVAFVPGLTGLLYNQFALTVAVAVALSGFNSLSLSPALCATFLRPDAGRPHGRLGRALSVFDRVFRRTIETYSSSVEFFARHDRAVLAGFVLLSVLAGTLLWHVPKGFVPQEDQGALLGIVEMPAASTLERTESVMRRFGKRAGEVPGVQGANTISGFDIATGAQRPSAGVSYLNLLPWGERTTPETQLAGIQANLEKLAADFPEATFTITNIPAILGLGSTGDFSFQLQDLDAAGSRRLAAVANRLVEQANAQPELTGVYSNFDIEVPRRRLEIDRVKAKTRGVDVDDIFTTLQLNLGSLYVNNFNEFGRVYRVYIQADQSARLTEEDIGRLRVQNRDGQMIHLSAFVTVHPDTGPYTIQHYDMYQSAEIMGAAAPGYSIGQAVDAMNRLADATLPTGFGYQWSAIVYQQERAGNAGPLVFALSLVFVFLVLAAQYESWVMPIMILLSIPIGLLGAVGSLMLRGMDLDVFGQIGLLVLIGLVAKNAILIVEFARKHRERGASVLEAATEAARLRLRPILMTAFAFIVGLMPLVVATGPGAIARRSLGTVVVGGLLLATLMIILVPVFYYVIEGWRERRGATPSATSRAP